MSFEQEIVSKTWDEVPPMSAMLADLSQVIRNNHPDRRHWGKDPEGWCHFWGDVLVAASEVLKE